MPRRDTLPITVLLGALVVSCGALGQDIVFPSEPAVESSTTTTKTMPADVSTTPIPAEVSTVADNSTDTESHVNAVQNLLPQPASASEDDKIDLSPSAIGSRSVLLRQYSAGCRAPTGEMGTCGTVRNCPGIYRIRDSSYLRRFLCGYQGRTPLVCCPARWTTSYYYGYQTTTQAPYYGYGYGGYGDSYQQQPQYQNYYGQQFPQYGHYNPNPYSSYSQYPQYPRPVNSFHFSTTTRPAYVPTLAPDTTQPSRATTRATADPSKEVRPRKPSFLPSKCGVGHGISRIVGGTEALPGSYPWMAAIYIRSGSTWLQACGGALVTNKHVVTAAHCVVSGSRSQNLPTRLFLIRLGDHNLMTTDDLPQGVTVDVKVAKISRHSDFDSRTYKNDIAIMELEAPVQGSEYIKPVCLPYDGVYGSLDEEIAVVTGWGYTKYEGHGSDVLKQATIRIWPQAECKDAFKREVTITDEYICAGDGTGKKDSCQGDSGGPLVYNEGTKFYLIGIVSFGKKCATPGYPGAYTRVTKYLDWLNNHF
ncbi:proclotting enzyme-like [Tropilaelaps mercedesae]|uniref:CLIP domain-containing serine protease n=1 Tax=Tropilaelaps mercedesae TaxID=418985 RepID=A0A1V9X1W8_9ACAR|nr:proclotting enzyme-like [Tropilaelaps mercedesae]